MWCYYCAGNFIKYCLNLLMFLLLYRFCLQLVILSTLKIAEPFFQCSILVIQGAIFYCTNNDSLLVKYSMYLWHMPSNLFSTLGLYTQVHWCQGVGNNMRLKIKFLSNIVDINLLRWIQAVWIKLDVFYHIIIDQVILFC